MSALASLMARLLWRAMLWLMRRRWMKTLQRKSILLFPERMRAKAWEGMVRQNRFARRIGLPMLKFMMTLVLGSLIVTGTFMTAMHLYETGYLTIPWRLRRKLFAE